MSSSSFQLEMDLLGGCGRKYSYSGVLGKLSARNLAECSPSVSEPMPSAVGLSLRWKTILAPFSLQIKPGIRQQVDRETTAE